MKKANFPKHVGRGKPGANEVKSFPLEFHGGKVLLLTGACKPGPRGECCRSVFQHLIPWLLHLFLEARKCCVWLCSATAATAGVGYSISRRRGEEMLGAGQKERDRG